MRWSKKFLRGYRRARAVRKWKRSEVALWGATVAATGLLCVACGYVPSRGEVVGKRFEPAHSYVYFIPIGCGKYGCTLIPMEGYEPNKWKLHLRDCEVKAECKSGWLAVSEQQYGQLAVGQYFDSKAPYITGVVQPQLCVYNQGEEQCHPTAR